MNRIFLAAWTLVVPCLGCFGQTNLPVAAPQPLPPLALKLSPLAGQPLLAVSLATKSANSDKLPDPPARADVSSQAEMEPPRGRLFPPPELKLHELPFRTEEVSRPAPRQTGAFSSHVSPDLTPAQMALFDRIEREGLLQSPTPVFDSDVARRIAAAFRPEILHVGHVEIYSPIVTAIARRNPLCLLDPMVLGISF